MERNYWEKIAPDYSEEIFDVLANDKKGIIRKTIKRFAARQKTVIDIGCAIGKWLPLLSPAFKKVYAIDISQKNLDIAKKNHSDLYNIQYSRIDMSNAKAKITACDFAICINAILTGTLKKRNIFFNNLRKCVKRTGHIILVIPSLESAMLASIVRQTWNPDKDAKKIISKNKAVLQIQNLLQGNTNIDDVPHKHYLKEELELLLNNEGFSTEKFHKLEYDWNTEFLTPLKWLTNPKPWDWMVLAKKK